MVELRSVLSDDEQTLVRRLNSKLTAKNIGDERNDAYYEGSIRIAQLGLAIPPGLELLETFVNWPRVVVDELSNRMQWRAVMRPGDDRADDALMEGFAANNLASEAPILHTGTMILGRGYVTVGTNEDDPEHPRILVESPREMSCLVDNRRRRMDAALRTFVADNGERLGTLMLPDRTLQLIHGRGGWQIDEVGDDVGVDEHDLGQVPVVLYLNRRRAGDWLGTTEMGDVIPVTDACARAITNLQFAVETHATPTKTALGVKKADFVNAKGDPITAWESYMTSVWSSENKDAKLGILQASDLRNFHETIGLYGEMASSVTGLPMRYFGKNAANPAAEGAIRADESRIIKNAENKMTNFGDCWGWVAALYERFRTGEWLPGNQIQVEWHNAATPTVSERADAIQKLNGGTPVYSREGSWDELGWSEARKRREERYFEDESADPVLDRVRRTLDDQQQKGRSVDDAAAAGVS